MKGLFVYDSEASGLLDEPDLHMHCALFKEYKKDNWHMFLPKEREGYDQAVKFIASKGYSVKIYALEELNDWFVSEPRALACHNAYGYDLRLFNKLLGTKYDMFADPKCMGSLNGKQVSLYDTLSMSRTLYPDRPLPRGCPEMVKNPVTGKMKPVGPHGLEAWGMRLANQKVAIEDWRGLPLWKYCDRVIEDVIITELLWEALMKEMTCDSSPDDKRFMFKDEPDLKGMKLINWKDAMRRGMLTDYLMVEQEIQGVTFDEEAALKLRDRIDVMMRDIEGDVEPHLPKKEMAKSAQPTFPSKPFKGDGSLSGTGWKWLEKLGYNVNWEALDFKGPPAKSFKADGSLTAAAIKYCNEHGIEDEAAMPQFIRDQNNKQTTLIPLSPEDMARAMLDLKNQTMPDIMIPMRIGNQDDVKKFLIRDAGWKPTLWRSKDVTKDQFKKQRPDNEVDGLVREYIEQLDQVEYRDLILEYLGITLKAWQDKEKMYKLLRRKARGLPTSPQLKDMSGLCPNLERVEGHMAKQIVKWLSLRNRRSVLDPLKEEKVDTGWLNHPRLRIDGKLPARYSGITNTGRRKHTIVANVPKPDEKVLLGKEMRSLFKASEGKYQVGIDGSNLEGMIAAWGAYEFDGGAYLRIMEAEDAHLRNAEAYTKAAGKKVSRGEGKGVTYG
ncbi:DNA polymerase [Pectobacterium phage phiTE]|uniref:DNA polymerase n=1 Tax=Pectobacterium phage phiTE TaxID=1116482 RepID=K9L4S8_9CAUD|nr:DNA polymerase [Pectobacterium atrosepticum]YP_007392472.1 DNA polymerase [Pectobacterium phage phiTE]AEZ66176.1 DNA polymerase [Pectobacterium phage phiTE]